MKNALKIELGFGVCYDRDNNPIDKVSADLYLVYIKEKAAQLFGGYTLVPTFGGWKNAEGDLVEEPGYALFVLCSDNEADRIKAMELACFVRDTFRQACVALTITYVQSDFI